MSNYGTYLAAINAARKQFGKEYKSHVDFEKIDGAWYVQVKQVEQAVPNDAALVIEAEDKTIEAQQAAADQQANQAQVEAVSDAPKGKVWVRASSAPKPTKLVWMIADEMVEAAAAKGEARPSRGAIQDECVRRGIASGTARTQYQAWKKANDETRANEAHAAELSKRFNSK